MKISDMPEGSKVMIKHRDMDNYWDATFAGNGGETDSYVFVWWSPYPGLIGYVEAFDRCMEVEMRDVLHISYVLTNGGICHIPRNIKYSMMPLNDTEKERLKERFEEYERVLEVK